MEINTKRLILKPTSTSDAQFQVELMNQPKWIENIGQRHVHTIQDAEKYIEDKMISQFKRLGFGNYTIFLKGSLIPIGSVGLYDREGLEGVDLGFALLPQYTKKGYVHEACLSLLASAKKDFKLNIINAITIPSNVASQNVLTKLGFKQEKEIELNGERLLYFQKRLA